MLLSHKNDESSPKIFIGSLIKYCVLLRGKIFQAINSNDNDYDEDAKYIKLKHKIVQRTKDVLKEFVSFYYKCYRIYLKIY